MHWGEQLLIQTTAFHALFLKTDSKLSEQDARKTRGFVQHMDLGVRWKKQQKRSTRQYLELGVGGKGSGGGAG